MMGASKIKADGAIALCGICYLSNEGKGMFELSTSEYSVDKGQSVSITISRVGGSVGSASVTFSTKGKTATAGQHYT